MRFINSDGGIWVNTDHITHIEPGTTKGCIIWTTDGMRFKHSTFTARGLVKLLEPGE